MPPIILFNIFTPERFEAAVLAVFREALCRLANCPTHTRHEKYLNFSLCQLAEQVHWEFTRSGSTFPFVIQPEAANSPASGDTAKSPRLDKYPDFTCAMTNEHATAPEHFRIRYYLECKRLGAAENTWVLNRNYSTNGIVRFQTTEHGYGQGCRAAAMIGYMQNTMSHDEILDDVNEHATALTIPNLSRGTNPWAERGATDLNQSPLRRDFDPIHIQLRHLWVDLSRCTFLDPPAPPPKPPKPPKKKKKKAQSKKVASRKTPSKKTTGKPVVSKTPRKP